VRAAAPPRQPAIERDLAVVVAEDRPAGEVAAAIRAGGGDAVGTISLFDVYRGTPLEKGEKSLAFRLAFAPADRPLTDAEVDAALEAITSRISADVAGRIRT